MDTHTEKRNLRNHIAALRAQMEKERAERQAKLIEYNRSVRAKWQDEHTMKGEPKK